jgi:hypothetical protein
MSATVRNCLEASACPHSRDWMLPGLDSAITRCDWCDRSVYLCTTDAEVFDLLRAGHLVAWAEPTDAELGTVYAEKTPRLAVPLAWGPPTPEQAVARRLRDLGSAIADAVGNARHASRACPGCGCPVPNYRLGCRVCGVVVGRLYDPDGNVLWARPPG